MRKKKLQIDKCKVVKGKTYIDYDLLLIADDGNPLVAISIYKENGMTKAQRDVIASRLKKALDGLIYEVQASI